MVAGGTAPRYIRLRPRPSLLTILDEGSEQAFPDGVHRLIARTTVEILTLRPTTSLGLGSAGSEVMEAVSAVRWEQSLAVS
jgi:hypothetical protein